MRTVILGIVCAGFLGFAALDQAPAQKDKDKVEPAIFEVYKDKSEEFRFRFKEGDTILAISGKGYKAKADVDKVIASIQKDAAKAKIVDDTKGK